MGNSGSKNKGLASAIKGSSKNNVTMTIRRFHLPILSSIPRRRSPGFSFPQNF